MQKQDGHVSAEKKVIFWDFDGTLVYSNTSFLDALTGALEKAGLRDREACRIFLRDACSWNRPQEAYPQHTGELWWKDLLGRTEDFCRQLGLSNEETYTVCREFRCKAVSYPYRLYEDSLEILKLAKHLSWENYLLSNNFPELRNTLKILGLEPYFSGCILSAEVGYEKPREEIFQYALQAAGNPSHVWMVGDNPAADMGGACAAGIQTILVHRDIPCPYADHRVKSLMDLRRYL